MLICYKHVLIPYSGTHSNYPEKKYKSEGHHLDLVRRTPTLGGTVALAQDPNDVVRFGNIIRLDGTDVVAHVCIQHVIHDR